MARDVEYGDPPNVGCCEMGLATTSVTKRVLQFWRRADGDWERVPELEATSPTEGCVVAKPTRAYFSTRRACERIHGLMPYSLDGRDDVTLALMKHVDERAEMSISLVAKQMETDRLRKVVNDANEALFDVCHNDHEHMIECHAEGLPDEHRRVANGAEKALAILQVIVQENVGG